MSDNISELVKRLRATDDDWPAGLLALEMEAADALAAQAAEIERLTKERQSMQRWIDHHNERADKAEAEVERLRAALGAFVKHFGPLQDNAMLHDDVRNCYRLARAALEEK